MLWPGYAVSAIFSDSGIGTRREPIAGDTAANKSHVMQSSSLHAMSPREIEEKRVLSLLDSSSERPNTFGERNGQ